MTIAGKEFKSYLASPTAYIVISVFLVFTGACFSFISPFNTSTYVETSIRGFLQPASIVVL